jgi:NAD(P)-dependent dehydrogenase (short-subunit alcohol dehydrogenase family)
MKKVIVVTGASSGFGALASRALARAGSHRLRWNTGYGGRGHRVSGGADSGVCREAGCSSAGW